MYEVLKRGRTHNLSVECQLELFDKMVKPILLYGLEIWGFSKNIDCLEKIQKYSEVIKFVYNFYFRSIQ
jgi:hypothetical protein